MLWGLVMNIIFLLPIWLTFFMMGWFWRVHSRRRRVPALYAVPSKENSRTLQFVETIKNSKMRKTKRGAYVADENSNIVYLFPKSGTGGG